MHSSPLALDLGASQVSGARFRRRGKEVRMEEFGSENFAAESGSEAAWLESVTAALAKLVERHRWRGPCRLALPAPFTLTKTIRLPAGVTAAGLARPGTDPAIDRVVAAHLPLPLEQVGWSMMRLGDGEEALLTAVKLAVLRPLLATLASFGLEVERVVPTPLALRDGFCHLHPNRETAVVLVHEMARTAHVVFLAGASAGFCAVRAAPRFDSVALDPDSALVAAIVQAIANLSGSPGRAGLRRIYLSGRASSLAGMAEKLSKDLEVPVTCLAATASFECVGSLRTALDDCRDGQWIGLLGLACPPPSSALGTINLLPVAEERRRRTRDRLRRVVAVAAVLVAVMLPPTVYSHHRATEAVAELNLQERKIATLRRRQAKLNHLTGEQAAIRQRLAAWERAGKTSDAWLDLFARLESQIAETQCVWLDQLTLERPREKTAATGAARPSRPPRGQGLAVKSPGGGGREPAADEIRLSGRIFDLTSPPASRVASAAYARGQELLARLRTIPTVAAVTHERFDPGPEALLRFEVILRLRPASLL